MTSPHFNSVGLRFNGTRLRSFLSGLIMGDFTQDILWSSVIRFGKKEPVKNIGQTNTNCAEM